MTPEPLSAVWTAGEAGCLALVSPDDGAVLTFDELAGRVEELAGKLRALGVERGDRVALVLANGPEIVPLLFALAAPGAAAAPLNPAYTADEFAFYLGDLAPRIVLLPEGELPAARAPAAGATEIVEAA